MADAIELEEMVVRFVADQTQYIKQVKEVHKATEDVAVAAKATTQLFQDANGKWRNSKGQFATMMELKAAAAEARTAAANGSVEAAKYAEQLEKVSKSLDHATNSQVRHSRAIQETATSQSSVGQMLGKAAGFAAPMVAGLSIGGLTSAMSKGVMLAAQAESVEITFETIIGNAEKAQQVLGELRAFADWSPFNTGEVMEAGKMMMAMGTTADQVVNIMMTMGDVAGALDIPIKDLTYLMGTLQSVGRATTVDLNQFALRGIPIWRELADMMYGDPKAVDKVRKAVEAGQISFDIVDKAFKKMTSAGGMFYQGMQKQATGLSGLWATFQSETENTLRAFGKEVIENLDLKWVLSQVTDLTKKFTAFFGQLSPETKRFIVFTVAAVAGIMGIVGAVVLLGTVFNTLFGGMGVLIGLLVTGGAVLGGWAASTGKLQVVWRELVYHAKRFWEWVKPLAPVFVGLLVVVNPLLGVVLLLAAHWKEVSQAVRDFAKWADPILRELGITVTNLATTIRDGLVGAWNWVGERLKGLGTVVKDVWNKLTGGLEFNWAGIQTGLRDMIVFAEYSFYNLDKVADVAWAAIKYAAVASFNYILNNVFVAILAVAFPQILMGMVVDWKAMFVSMAGAALAFGFNLTKTMRDIVGNIALSFGRTFETMWRQLLTGKFDTESLAKAWIDLGPEIEKQARKLADTYATNFTPDFKGVKIKALDNMEAQLKKELDEKTGKLSVDFSKFKEARNAKVFWDSLFQIGKEGFFAGLQPVVGAAGNVGKEAGEAMGGGIADGMKKEVQKVDGVLRGSLAEAVRTQEYLDYLNMSKNPKFSPNLPPGAVPIDQWTPPTQQVEPLGNDVKERNKVVELLGIIAGSLSKIEAKPPALAGDAGL